MDRLWHTIRKMGVESGKTTTLIQGNASNYKSKIKDYIAENKNNAKPKPQFGVVVLSTNTVDIDRQI